MNNQSFEEFLFSKGYKKYVILNGEYVLNENAYISSMGHCTLYYINGDNRIEYGFLPATNGVEPPPFWAFPLPKIIESGILRNTNSTYGKIHQVHQLFDNETIYKAMYDKSIVLNLDTKQVEICTQIQ